MAKAMVGVLAAALSLGLLAGCGGDEAPPETGPDKPGGVIGLSVLTMTNPFFKEIADVVTAEAASHGYEVIVTSAEFDPARQRTQVKDFLVRKVSAMILTPADSKAVGTAIKEANEAGIPVFTADIASLAEDAKVVSHIATDNYAGGQLAAERTRLGTLAGRGQPTITRVKYSAGAAVPEGLYINVSFPTRFANSAQPVRELVSFRFDEDQVWRLAGYSLRASAP